MAIHTAVDLGGARRIGARYGLSVTALRGILAGSVNTNYECSLEGGGRVFLRVYEEQGEAAARREMRLLSHLYSAGVAVVPPLSQIEPHDATGLPSYAGKAAAMFPWADGECLCQERVSESALEAVGAALAKIHLAGADFNEMGPGRFDAAHLMGRIDKLRALPVAGGELGEVVLRLADKLRAHMERESRSAEPAPRTLIHGDVFRDNVLWQGGKIAAILDFESASQGAMTFDLAVAMLAWCYSSTLEQGLARALVRGYVRERPLAAGEKARLYEDAIFAALRFSITRITDYELRPRGTIVYKDYRRFLGRLSFIEGLGPEGLPAFLGL